MPEPLLYLSWMGELGGAEVALLRLLKSLDRSLFEIHAWQLQPGPLQGLLEELQIPVTLFERRRFRHLIWNVQFHRELCRYLQSHSIGLVHAVGTLSYLAGYLASRLARVPILWWLVDRPEGKNLLEKIAGALPSDLIVCNSRATQEAFRRHYPQHKSRCEVVYPSIEWPRTLDRASQARLRREFGIDSGPVITCVGRLQRWKGQHILIRSIPTVLKDHPQAVFLFVGGALPGMEEGYPSFLKGLARELHVEAHCRFLGFRSDAGPLMDASDLIVHTSVTPEPFGLVVAEAMARGKAVIAADQGGPREIIDHGRNGWLVAPQKPEILAQAIGHLLRDANLRHKLGQEGLKTAEQFEPLKIARQMEDLYRKVLSQQGTGKTSLPVPC